MDQDNPHEEAETFLVRPEPTGDLADVMADRYEANWTPDSVKQLESMLARVPEEQREAVLLELLHMEFELRFKNGFPVDRDRYAAVFPTFEREIRTVYRELLESRKFGEYEYYEKLGQGGMGVVYRARQTMLDRIAAVKSLHDHILKIPGTTERFLREVRLVGRLKHPNIVRAEYAGRVDHRYYLAMEFVEGENVKDVVGRRGPLSIPVACEILRQAATGIQYAFKQGIVHRDIKPGNLMITAEGVVKILDFGLGKFQSIRLPEDDHSLTTIGSTLGSVDYIAPEQWEDASSVAVQADIYSLGCTLFFLLTGRAPFETEQMNREQKMIAHLKGRIPSLREVRDDVTPELESCYRKMVAKNPEDRFSQPLDIVRLLEPFASRTELAGVMRSSHGEPAQSDGGESTILSDSRKSSGLGSFRWVSALCLLLAGAVACLVLFRPGTSAPPETSHSDSTMNAAEQRSQLPLPPSARHPSVELNPELVQFMGYSGDWWFESMPWFLPAVRVQMAEMPLNCLSPDLLRQEALCHGERLAGIEKQVFDFFTSFRESGTPEDERAFETVLEALLGSGLSTASETVATVLHTRALCLHRLALLKNDPGIAGQAGEEYQVAIRSYDDRTGEVDRLLGNLCRFDAARLDAWLDADPDVFQKKTAAIEATDNDPAFRAELLLAPAERQMEEGKNQDAIFHSAIELLKNERKGELKGDARLHPMLPRLHQRYALALSRQWRLADAETHWKKSVELAQQLPDSDQSPDLDDFERKSRMALAATARYSGDLKTARRRYRDLLETLQDLPESDDPHRVRQLTEALEGLADCTLFTPSYFGASRPRNTAYYVEDAEDLYLEAARLETDPNEKFVLQCKLALLKFMVGDRAEALNAWRSAKESEDHVAVLKRRPRSTVFFEVGSALFDSAKVFPDLRRILGAARLNRNMCDRYAGEKLDLHLFCTRLLLEATLRTNDLSTARKDLGQYLEPVLSQHLISEQRMRPFLLPYYDLTIHCVDPTDLVSIVEIIRDLRCQRRPGITDGSYLVFYFGHASENGFAIYLSPDLQDGCRFDLGVNRNELFEALENGRSLALPEELVLLVEKSWAESTRIELSWDETACEKEGRRLTYESWPFGDRPDPKRLFGIVK